jgi:hypothetical protein
MAYRPEGPWAMGRTGRRFPDPSLRVGDAERNQVADALSQHFTEGRLDATELKERLDRAMSAKTRGDLGGLMTDLPALPAPPPPPVTGRRRIALWTAAVLLLIAVATPWHYVAWPWGPRVPWLLLGVVALGFWARARRRDRRRALPPV